MPGTRHPVVSFIDQAAAYFEKQGFVVIEGGEIESAFYNFDLLNIPPDHPAREAWDTFVVERPPQLFVEQGGTVVLRTHTSAMQGRVMRTIKPPLRVLVPGKVFRNEATDTHHLSEFYQLEGFVIDKDMTLSHLIGTMNGFFNWLFPKSNIFYTQSHFDFVEPGMEVHLRRANETLEVAGCGMIHPTVLHNVGIDPKVYRGFAFGMGVERLMSELLRVEDIRIFTSTDLRFLKQFPVTKL